MKTYTSIVLSNFFGTSENREFKKGQFFTGNEERTKHLLNLGYVKVVKLEHRLPIFSYWCKTSVFEHPYVSMVEEILSDIQIEETKYYNYLLPFIERKEVIFGHITTEEQLKKQALKFSKLAKDIRDNGFKDNSKIVFKDNLPYGKMTFIKENENYYLIDGHHRISILIYLGVKDFEVKDNYLIPKK